MSVHVPTVARSAAKQAGDEVVIDDDDSISPPSPPQVFRASPMHNLRSSPNLSFGLSPTGDVTGFSPVGRPFDFEDDRTKLQMGSDSEGGERSSKEARFDSNLTLPLRSPIRNDVPKLAPRKSEVQPRNLWQDASAGETNVRRLTMGGPLSGKSLEGINSMMKTHVSATKKRPKQEQQRGDGNRPSEERLFPSAQLAGLPSHYAHDEALRHQHSARMYGQHSYPMPDYSALHSYPYSQYRSDSKTPKQPKLPPTFEPPRSKATTKAPPSYRPTSITPASGGTQTSRFAASPQMRRSSTSFESEQNNAEGMSGQATGKENSAASAPATSPAKRQTCNCKKTKCLKMYCECFANKLFCEGCKCQDCHNNKQFEALRDKTLKEAIAKNRAVFEQRSTGQIVGCKCRRSECLKKYCEVRIVKPEDQPLFSHILTIGLLCCGFFTVFSSWCDL